MDYKELNAWKESMNLAEMVCTMFEDKNLNSHPLKKQLIRSVVSVPSNIAEGAGRQYKKENIQFIYIAKASLFEFETQILLAMRINLINNKSYILVNNKVEDCKKLIHGLLKYLRSANLR